MINIRECTTLAEMAECVRLQKEVFELPETELSPVRHLVVTKNAGGFVLGAYDGDELAGFVLSVPAFLRGERAFYSHMTGVRSEYQSHGIGGRLKWAQRERALADGVRYIKWTFEPTKARNAFFNLEKLGAMVNEYQRNFYGTDYAVTDEGKKIGLQSDRLFAEWDLASDRVERLSHGEIVKRDDIAVGEIAAINDWSELVKSDPAAALEFQLRLRADFENAFAKGLIAKGFRRDDEKPAYLLYA